MSTVRGVSTNPASPLYNANAPTLTGQAGSLTTMLDAILVNGVTGFTALGWSIAQTTTNKRGYQQASGGNSGATGLILWVDDTGPGAGGAREARCTGFETMTGLGTGTQQFPTGAQVNIGTTPNGAEVIRKSNTADGTTRFYTLVGNGSSFYLFTETGDYTNPTSSFGFFFGDFFSLHASDTYAIRICGRTVENSNAGVSGSTPLDALTSFMMNSSQSGVQYNGYVDRAYTGVGGSQATSQQFDMTMMLNNYNAASMGYNGNPAYNPYPNPADGALHLSPVGIVTTGGGGIRGYMPGMWAPQHHLPLNHGDTYTVSGGNLNGKSLIAMNVVMWVFNSITSTGQVHIEYSNTWASP